MKAFNPKTKIQFMKITFIGHSSLLLETAGARLVTDPHFNSRMLWLSRERPPGVNIESLTDVDGILVSHGHLDHLDPRTLRRFGEGATLAVPPGLGWIGRRCVNGRTTVLRPWETIGIGSASITAVPVNHVNFRPGFIFGRGTGYLIEVNGLTLFFAGDTSYFDGFGAIGGRREIDVAFLPIGPLRPEWFQRRFHMNPDQALLALKELGARMMVPIHWGAFRYMFDGARDAVRRFVNSARKMGLKNRIVVLEPGESAIFSRS